MASAFGTTPSKAETLIFHASQSGRATLDQGEGGGNPFASALVELVAQPSISLAEFSKSLRVLTSKKSKGFQLADVPTLGAQTDDFLAPAKPGSRRIGLVLIVSDYTKSGGAQSLPGARRDAQRIASALQKAGFDTELVDHA